MRISAATLKFSAEMDISKLKNNMDQAIQMFDKLGQSINAAIPKGTTSIRFNVGQQAAQAAQKTQQALNSVDQLRQRVLRNARAADLKQEQLDNKAVQRAISNAEKIRQAAEKKAEAARKAAAAQAASADKTARSYEQQAQRIARAANIIENEIEQANRLLANAELGDKNAARQAALLQQRTVEKSRTLRSQISELEAKRTGPRGDIRPVTAIEQQAIDQANNSLQEANRQLGQFAERWGKLPPVIQQSAQSMQEVFIRWAMIEHAVMNVTLALRTAFQSSAMVVQNLAETGIGFNKMMAMVDTVARYTPGKMQLVKDSILDMTQEIPRTAEDFAKGLYSIVSAMGATGKELEVLSNANKDALAGFTDLEVSSKALSIAMNVYGDEVESISQISDVMFKMVEYGIAPYEEFARSFGLVLNTAKAMGQPLGTVAGALAYLNKQGISVSRSVTYLNQVFRQIPKRAEDLKAITGVEVKDTAGNFRNLVDIMNDLNKSLQGLTPYAKVKTIRAIFPDSRELMGIQTILNNMEMFNEVVKGTTDSLGAQELAVRRATDYPGYKVEQFINQWKTLKLELSTGVLIALEGIIKTVSKLSKWISDLPDSVKRATGEFIVWETAIIGLATGVTYAIWGVVKFTATLQILQRVLIATGIQVTGIGTLAGAMKFLFSGWGVVILAVATAIGIATSAFISHRRAVHEAKMEAALNAEKMKEETQNAYNLVEEYKKLTEETSKTAAEKGRLKEVTNQLIGLLPTLNTQLDSQGRLTFTAADATKALKEQTLELIEAERIRLQIQQDTISVATSNTLETQRSIQMMQKWANKPISSPEYLFPSPLNPIAISPTRPEYIKKSRDALKDVERTYKLIQDTAPAAAAKTRTAYETTVTALKYSISRLERGKGFPIDPKDLALSEQALRSYRKVLEAIYEEGNKQLKELSPAEIEKRMKALAGETKTPPGTETGPLGTGKKDKASEEFLKKIKQDLEMIQAQWAVTTKKGPMDYNRQILEIQSLRQRVMKAPWAKEREFKLEELSLLKEIQDLQKERDTARDQALDKEIKKTSELLNIWRNQVTLGWLSPKSMLYKISERIGIEQKSKAKPFEIQANLVSLIQARNQIIEEIAKNTFQLDPLLKGLESEKDPTIKLEDYSKTLQMLDEQINGFNKDLREFDKLPPSPATKAGIALLELQIQKAEEYKEKVLKGSEEATNEIAQNDKWRAEQNLKSLEILANADKEFRDNQFTKEQAQWEQQGEIAKRHTERQWESRESLFRARKEWAEKETQLITRHGEYIEDKIKNEDLLQKQSAENVKRWADEATKNSQKQRETDKANDEKYIADMLKRKEEYHQRIREIEDKIFQKRFNDISELASKEQQVAILTERMIQKSEEARKAGAGLGQYGLETLLKPGLSDKAKELVTTIIELQDSIKELNKEISKEKLDNILGDLGVRLDESLDLAEKRKEHIDNIIRMSLVKPITKITSLEDLFSVQKTEKWWVGYSLEAQKALSDISKEQQKLVTQLAQSGIQPKLQEEYRAQLKDLRKQQRDIVRDEEERMYSEQRRRLEEYQSWATGMWEGFWRDIFGGNLGEGVAGLAESITEATIKASPYYKKIMEQLVLKTQEIVPPEVAMQTAMIAGGNTAATAISSGMVQAGQQIAATLGIAMQQQAGATTQQLQMYTGLMKPGIGGETQTGNVSVGSGTNQPAPDKNKKTSKKTGVNWIQGAAGAYNIYSGAQNMSTWGGVLSGAAQGFMLGGPVGAAIGGLVGLFGSKNRNKEKRKATYEEMLSQYYQPNQIPFASPQFLPFGALAGGMSPELAFHGGFSPYGGGSYKGGSHSSFFEAQRGGTTINNVTYYDFSGSKAQLGPTDWRRATRSISQQRARENLRPNSTEFANSSRRYEATVT